jgi:hypothetical protein
MNLKKIAATATMAGALGGFVALGVGAGTAQADKGWDDWCGPVPCPDFDVPPGHIGVGPPGQFKKEEFIPGTLIPNPVFGVPPGHWDEVNPWWWVP